MSIYRTRTDSRQSSKCRRIADRRLFPYPFGSQAWIDHIKNHYLAWPKDDRRIENRRESERRALELAQQPFFGAAGSKEIYSPILLTQEERMMIQDLYLSDTL